MTTPLSFGFLVFPDIQQLDLTGPYEIVSVLDRPKQVHLIWRDRAPVRSTTGIDFTPPRPSRIARRSTSSACRAAWGSTRCCRMPRSWTS